MHVFAVQILNVGSIHRHTCTHTPAGYHRLAKDDYLRITFFIIIFL